jgi:predicted transcriptional regulator
MAINSFIAGESISTGNAVYLSASGYLYKSIATDPAQASVVGVAADSGSFGSLIRVNSDAVFPTVSGLTPGEYRYVSIVTSGQMVSYTTWAADLSASTYSGAYLTIVGRATSSTTLEVEPSKPFFIRNPIL